MRQRVPAALGVCLSGLLVAAAPEVRAENDAPVLEEVTVTADRHGSFSADLVQAGSFRGARQLDTPLTINVVPGAVIESQQAQSLLEALRNTASVNASQVNTTVTSNLAIRGIAVENRSNYRLDGILPVVNLVEMPMEDKDRVEVLKGASALYYGFTTPAGIVNLTMKRPTPEPYLAATLFGNQYGAVGGHVDAGDTWGRFGARVNAVYGSLDPGIDHAGGHRSLLSAALDLRPVDSLGISLDAEHILKTVNEPGVYRFGRVPPPTPGDPYPALTLPPLLDPSTNFGPDWAENRAEETNLLATVNWKLSPAWALAASIGNSRILRDRRANNLDLDTWGPQTSGDGNLAVSLQPGARFENTNYRAELAGAVDTGPIRHELLVGASKNVRDGSVSVSTPVTCPGPTPAAPRVVCRQNIFDPVDIPETPFPDPTLVRTRIDDVGYYLFDRAELAHWLELLAGLRKNDYTEQNRDTGATTFHDDPLSLSYGAVVKPKAWMSLYATYIEGLESTPAAPLAAVNASEAMPAAESTQKEAGIKLEVRPGLLLQAAYFDIERGSAYVNGENVYVLDGRARYHGAEVSLTGELTPDLSVYFSGGLVSAKYVAAADTRVSTNPVTGVVTVVPTIKGRRVDSTPEHTLSLAAEYHVSALGGLRVNAATYYLSRRAVNDFNQAFVPGYTLFDVGGSYTTTFGDEEVTFRLNCQNVANRRYFAATGNSLVSQGPPRVVKFGLTVRF